MSSKKKLLVTMSAARCELTSLQLCGKNATTFIAPSDFGHPTLYRKMYYLYFKQGAKSKFKPSFLIQFENQISFLLPLPRWRFEFCSTF